MKKIILLCKAFLKREFILLKRYAFNSLGGFLTLYIVFLLMFWGYKGLAGGTENFGDMVEGLVVGYTLWVFAMSMYQDITFTIQREAREGTLEQLYMSVFNFGTVMGAKVLAMVLINFIVIVIILYTLMLTTGHFLSFDIGSVLVLLFFTLLSIMGIGFGLGGITLIFKRIDQYLQIVQFLLIGLIAAPIGRFPILKFLPASWGAYLIQGVMREGYTLGAFSPMEIVFLIGISIIHLGLGYGLYKICEKKAMEKGLLGHY